MSDDRSTASRAHALLRAALDRDADSRESFLLSATAEDPALRSASLALLAAIERSGRFLETPAWTPPLTAPAGSEADGAATTESLIGRTVGDITVVALAGVGGMGEVYRARQRTPDREVALKVIRSPHRGLRPVRSALARFEQEIRALGRLRHPNIAQIYSAGTFDRDGEETPFVALEWIDRAVPITSAADARGLDRAARLRLFVDIADAVVHAHGRGVVHRDLKPANVLVGADGVPKVIDFGVALLTDATVRATLDGQFVGSLVAMSPEQCARGAQRASVDVRCDVYALGALLYELVEGRPPLDLARLPLPDALAAITELAPAPPRRAGPDLALVLLTALSKSPDDRYRSVEAFRRDVLHVLHHEPIEARPPSAGRRVALFVRRHRAAVGAATVAITAVLIGGMVMAVSLVRATRAESATAARVVELTRVADFLRSLIANDDIDEGIATRTIASELDEWSERAERELADVPIARSTLRYAIGQAMLAVGRFDDAERLVRGGLDDLRLVRSGDEHTRTTTEVAMLGTLARVARDRGASDAALDRYATLFADHPAIVHAEGDPGEVIRSDYALLLHSLKRGDEAAPLLERVLDERTTRLGRSHQRTGATIGQLGRVRFGQGRDEEAVALYRESIAIDEAIHGPNSLASAATRNNLAVALQRLGRPAESLAILRELLELRTREQGADHPNTLTVEANCANLALAVATTDEEREEARRLAHECHARHRRILGPTARGSIITGIGALRASLELRRWEEIVSLAPTVRAAAEEGSAQFGASSWRVGFCDCLLGKALVELGREEEGRQLMEEGRTAMEGSQPSPELARHLERMRTW
jgi:eukaryotic-like serine/threonine-protein kinase